ncbi:hypothetical protein IFM89_025792 [Coptis chinensis]|uniref:Trichome birefringence-like N-terminal domain-containing protein n=1 Tax=Coptis chinensis TaxID=261450 RepID=A0A835HCZ7_9MAGN|nr:hypothetical protein IFM89_025792 [Coptis chinensis]
MKSPISSSSLRKARLSSYFFSLLAIIILFIVLYTEDYTYVFKQHPSRFEPELENHKLDRPITRKEKNNVAFAVGETDKECDLFNGKWVRDELNRPIYDESECPYIQPQLTCQEHGRPEKDYQFFRWQPHSCNLPRLLLQFRLFFFLHF